MARLSLNCLGPFQVTLDGQPVTSFKANKVRALLAYLAVEAERPHSREALATLLWPDFPDRDALSNLRYALADLRKSINDREAQPSFLIISRDMLQFNCASDHWLDVADFAESTNLDDPAALANAIDLYRGSFLEGFSVGDSEAFEEWALFTRERLARQMSRALHRLTEIWVQRGEYERAQSIARRQLEQEPWDEAAHQQLMRALSLAGRRSAALAQYKACVRHLNEELGVGPSEETQKLYEQIRTGALKSPGPPPDSPAELSARPPRFLDGEPPHTETSVFVSCETELNQMDSFLGRVLEGSGQVVFVTGEAGSGKTALVQEFIRRAQEAHADLIVAYGNCNAYTGIGDPYLPFREILELLTGDVEARWAVGALTRDHTRRLWNTLPLAVQAVGEIGPDLIDTFVPRTALLERATISAPARSNWLKRLQELVQHKPTGSSIIGPQQSDLFKQYTRVLQALARQAPLLLVVDDLQWSDPGSISLLFHLGRHLAGSRILLVGSYRPEEVAIGRDGERHPLDRVINEFRRDFGEITVNLDQTENRDFVVALLDSEPNRLGPSFREMLYRQTRGLPLFAIELLRGLQERGDLVKDQEGRWIEGPTLSWEKLPARVDAVIAERIERLDKPLRAALRVACVEGEVFTAEVVARIRAADERDMLGCLSRELDNRHRLIRAQSIQRLDNQLVSSYRFRHILFQKYLYDSLDEVERVHLHEQVGTTLEDLYGSPEHVTVIAPQLALHFQKARIADKAIHYLRQAGDRAVRLCAYQEGLAHLTNGLSLLMSLPSTADRAQQELDLQISLSIAYKAGIPDPEGEKVLTRARELCRQTGKVNQLSRVLGELSIFPYVRAEHHLARRLGEEALSLAQQAGDPLLVALGHWHLGFILFGLGEFAAARGHLHHVISFYEPEQHHQSFVLIRGSDAGVSALAYDACCLWCLGYPEQAYNRSQDALALARKLDHAFSLADVLCFGGCLFNAMRRDVLTFISDADELTRLSKVMGFSSFLGTGTCYRGQALALLGQIHEGLEQLREGIEARASVGARCYLSGILGALAEAQALAGQPQQGLSTLDEALVLVDETDERYCESELLRLKAEQLLLLGDDTQAEDVLHKAIEVARRQDARSWELRATTNLAHLWEAQGRVNLAYRALSEIYGWFTEGFDTPDLVEARAMLARLS